MRNYKPRTWANGAGDKGPQPLLSPGAATKFSILVCGFTSDCLNILDTLQVDLEDFGPALPSYPSLQLGRVGFRLRVLLSSSLAVVGAECEDKLR